MRVKCSGRIGCRVNPEMAAAFNRMAGKWWSELHRAAKVRADRETGRKGKLLARVWEKQKRGLAHLHGVVSVAEQAGVKWAEAHIGALRELAPRHAKLSQARSVFANAPQVIAARPDAVPRCQGGTAR